jgi:hypothetical protein
VRAESLRLFHRRFLRQHLLIRLGIWFGMVLAWAAILNRVEAASRAAGFPWWGYLGLAVLLCAYIALDLVPSVTLRRRSQTAHE